MLKQDRQSLARSPAGGRSRWVSWFSSVRAALSWPFLVAGLLLTAYVTYELRDFEKRQAIGRYQESAAIARQMIDIGLMRGVMMDHDMPSITPTSPASVWASNTRRLRTMVEHDAALVAVGMAISMRPEELARIDATGGREWLEEHGARHLHATGDVMARHDRELHYPVLSIEAADRQRDFKGIDLAPLLANEQNVASGMHVIVRDMNMPDA